MLTKFVIVIIRAWLWRTSYVYGTFLRHTKNYSCLTKFGSLLYTLGWFKTVLGSVLWECKFCSLFSHWLNEKTIFWFFLEFFVQYSIQIVIDTLDTFCIPKYHKNSHPSLLFKDPQSVTFLQDTVFPCILIADI